MTEEQKKIKKELKKKRAKVSKLHDEITKLRGNFNKINFDREKSLLERYYINSWRKLYSGVYVYVLNEIEEGYNSSANAKCILISIDYNECDDGRTIYIRCEESWRSYGALRTSRPASKGDVAKLLQDGTDGMKEIIGRKLNIKL